MIDFMDSNYRKVLGYDFELLGQSLPNIRTDSEKHLNSIADFIRSIPEIKARYKYQPEKWSVAEIVGHLIDTRVIWLYRLLWLARGETRPLPYADENLWNLNAGYSVASLTDLHARFLSLAQAIQSIVQAFPEEAWARKGEVNGVEFTVEQAFQTMMAHEVHHVRMLRGRYLAS